MVTQVNELAELIMDFGLLWMAIGAILAAGLVLGAAIQGHVTAPMAVVLSVPLQRVLVLNSARDP